MWVATASEIREIDRRAIHEFGIPSSALMEQAGFSVFHRMQEMLSRNGHATVVCGKGNNGGDGLVVARLLREHGKPVACFIAAGSENELSSDAYAQWERATASGVRSIFADDASWLDALKRALEGSEAGVDAMLGTGARGELSELVRGAVEALNASRKPVVAVDVPTGIDCDTGAALGVAVKAEHTVTFGLPKPFLFQGEGLERSGTWKVSDIGYPESLLGPTSALLLSPDLLRSALPVRTKASNKGQNGSLLIVAGSREMPGAASMVARAALRSGVGLITVASVASVCAAVAAHVPEAMLLPLPEIDGRVSPEASFLLLERQERIDAAVFGPGLSHDQPVQELLSQVWEGWHRPCIVDADALNCAANGAKLPRSECALTPHPGELARLLECDVKQIQSDRFTAARKACDTLLHPTLLKGAYTVSASHGQPLLINPTGNSGMATGGMGDALSGIIGTLLSQGLAPADALAMGAYWHGVAGDLCEKEIGAVGYSAMDLIERLPRARASILV